MAAALLCLLWQYQPSLVSQFVSRHPLASFPDVTMVDYPVLTAFAPLLGIALARGVLRYAEDLAFSEQLLQLIPWMMSSCSWVLNRHHKVDGITAEVLEESLVRTATLLQRMMNHSLQCLIDAPCSLATRVVPCMAVPCAYVQARLPFPGCQWFVATSAYS